MTAGCHDHAIGTLDVAKYAVCRPGRRHPGRRRDLDLDLLRFVSGVVGADRERGGLTWCDLGGLVRWVPRDNSRYFGVNIRKTFG